MDHYRAAVSFDPRERSEPVELCTPVMKRSSTSCRRRPDRSGSWPCGWV